MAATIRNCLYGVYLFRQLPNRSLQHSVTRCGGNFTDARVLMLKELKRRQDKEGKKPPQHRNTWVEWNYTAELYAFSKRVGENFKDNTLNAALTQRSYVLSEQERQEKLGIGDPKGSFEDNTALAEKGEIVMRDTIARYLRTALPLYPEEGILTIRDYLMSESVLASIASKIGAEELILCLEFPVPPHILASTMCSIVGAVYESNGKERTALFIRDFIITTLSGMEINDFWKITNPMKVLTQILEREGKATPEPRIISQFSPNSELYASFRVGIYTDKKMIGSGNGETIEAAIDQAAFDALWRMWGTLEGRLQLPFRLEASAILNNSSTNTKLEDWCSQTAAQNLAYIGK